MIGQKRSHGRMFNVEASVLICVFSTYEFCNSPNESSIADLKIDESQGNNYLSWCH